MKPNALVEPSGTPISCQSQLEMSTFLLEATMQV